MTAPKERGILMSGQMVRAILAGKKTQTRRAVKPRIYRERPGDRWHWIDTGNGTGHRAVCPYDAPRLWVRETWQQLGSSTDWETGIVDDVFAVEKLDPNRKCAYRADPGWEHFDNVEERGFSWRPSLLMPRWASRITLAVESIRVERAQDITDADIEAEGVDAEAVEALWRDATRKRRGEVWLPNGAPAFDAMRPCDLWRMAWTLINGRASWDANPWVWVVSFRRTP